MREIDQKTTSLNRDAQDAQADVDQESQKIMQELGGRMMAVLNKYAKDKGYTLVLDVGSQQSPVLYAPDDITEEIIKLYDQNAPAAAPCHLFSAGFVDTGKACRFCSGIVHTRKTGRHDAFPHEEGACA